ncbi:hypothetical protein BP00DRAFT_454169 [Aspergillus indologenus CBS 114.80]|uniref:Peptidase S8/S53 domain-containing protein n=1 Tax=Aspergillus indologenus CBS 114.80 TaxID=1450541 RepID=A0A2V5IMD3_9EURO|nr:hypothetical protein BP00DRAFT_454169 [Aspergillus indologenus CBS 114.80]
MSTESATHTVLFSAQNGEEECLEEEESSDDEPNNLDFPTLQASIPSQTSEEGALRTKDIYDRCSHIFDELSQGRRKWSEEDGCQNNPEAPVLEPYKKQILTESDGRDKGHPSLLHALARKWGQYPINHPGLRQAVIHIVEGAPIGLSKEAAIWREAVSHGHLGFLEFIQQHRPTRLETILAMRDDRGWNFFHYVFGGLRIEGKRKKEILTLGMKYSPQATAEILSAQDKAEGNTPIHYAMHPQTCCGRGEEYIGLVEDMVKRADNLMRLGAEFNKLDQSPYQYCCSQSELKEAKKGQSGNAARGSTVAGDLGGKRENPSSVQESNPRMTLPVANSKISRGSNLAIDHLNPDEPLEVGSRTSSTNWLAAPTGHTLRRSPTIPPTLGVSQANPDHLPKPQQVGNGGAGEKEKRERENREKENREKENREKSKNRLLRFLHHHYIRERQDGIARDLIYGKNTNEKNLYFNATSLEGKSTDKIVDLIDRLSIGGFNSVLSCVCIPATCISPSVPVAPTQEPKTYSRRPRDSRKEPVLEVNPHQGRDCLKAVFDRLHKVGVRRIIRLHVDDMGDQPHMDSAIERAICGHDAFGIEDSRHGDPIIVEEFDWQKPDLGIEVIQKAAPDVEHLTLYWSGNTTILRGWASKEYGIPLLCRPATKSKLKTVVIKAAPGFERTERMRRIVEKFCESVKADIEKSAQPKIRADYQMSDIRRGPMASSSIVSLRGGDTSEGDNRDKWMAAMDHFRGALHRIHTSLPKVCRHAEKVKVALIDDGVALESLPTWLENQIVEASGIYYPSGEHTEKPWHCSTNGHGTVMANMITRVNPWVSLCSMRVHDTGASDGARMIEPRSAAMAVWGAIGRKADIICMSWTILAKVQNSSGETASSSGIQDLRNAIQAAVAAGVLIFCSANDDISVGVMDFLPYQQAPDYIFRIGAANAHGQRDRASEDVARMNFYLPGNKVAETDNPNATGPVEYHTGASVSTALAAGLASLIIYCAIVVQAYYKSVGNDQSAEEFARKHAALKVRNHMDTAFKSIKADGWGKRLYPPVWGAFGIAAKAIEAEIETEGKMHVLVDLVHRLSPQIR